jgi:hypothetical protein
MSNFLFHQRPSTRLPDLHGFFPTETNALWVSIPALMFDHLRGFCSGGLFSSGLQLNTILAFGPS